MWLRIRVFREEMLHCLVFADHSKGHALLILGPINAWRRRHCVLSKRRKNCCDTTPNPKTWNTNQVLISRTTLFGRNPRTFKLLWHVIRRHYCVFLCDVTSKLSPPCLFTLQDVSLSSSHSSLHSFRASVQKSGCVFKLPVCYNRKLSVCRQFRICRLALGSTRHQ